MRRLRSAAEKLRKFPNLGGVIPEFEELGLREIYYGSYRVVYHHSENTVTIVTVQHAAQPLDEGSLGE